MALTKGHVFQNRKTPLNHTCPECGVTRESVSAEFAVRKYCSKACELGPYAAPKPTVCSREGCNEPLKPWNGRVSVARRRLYCSTACANTVRWAAFKIERLKEKEQLKERRKHRSQYA